MPPQIHAAFNPSVRQYWPRYSKTYTNYLFQVDLALSQYLSDSNGNIFQYVFPTIFLSCRDLPLKYQPSVCLEQAQLYSRSAYIYTNALFVHTISPFWNCQFYSNSLHVV